MRGDEEFRKQETGVAGVQELQLGRRISGRELYRAGYSLEGARASGNICTEDRKDHKG